MFPPKLPAYLEKAIEQYETEIKDLREQLKKNEKEIIDLHVRHSQEIDEINDRLCKEIRKRERAELNWCYFSDVPGTSECALKTPCVPCQNRMELEKYKELCETECFNSCVD